MVCCFFGHQDTPERVRPLLREEILKLIETHGDVRFYVGDHGNFDSMVHTELEKMKKSFPHLRYAVVLAYMPKAAPDYERRDFENDTIYPEGLETVPKRYAISARNRWMVEQSDTVICYKKHDIGGAAQFVRLAARKGRRIINLADRMEDTGPHYTLEEMRRILNESDDQ